MPLYTYVEGHQYQGLTTEMGELSEAQMKMIGVVPAAEGKGITPKVEEEKKSHPVQPTQPVEPAIEEAVEEPTILEVQEESTVVEESLEYWQSEYLKATSKEVPPRYKNDLDWIKTKLQK